MKLFACACLMLVFLWLALVASIDTPKPPRFVHLRGHYSARYPFDVTVWIEPHADIRYVVVDVWEAVQKPSPFAEPDADMAVYETGEFKPSGSQQPVTERTQHVKTWRFKITLDEGTYWIVAKVVTGSFRPIKETRSLIKVV